MLRINELPLKEDFINIDPLNLAIPVILSDSTPINIRIKAANKSFFDEVISVDSLSALYQSVDFNAEQFSSSKETILNLNDDNELVGIITDGDIRRGLEKIDNDLLNEKAEFLMSKDPKWVTSDTLALSALELMEKYAITSLFVYSDPSLKKPDGIVHIHDILKSGIQ